MAHHRLPGRHCAECGRRHAAGCYRHLFEEFGQLLCPNRRGSQLDSVGRPTEVGAASVYSGHQGQRVGCGGAPGA